MKKICVCIILVSILILQSCNVRKNIQADNQNIETNLIEVSTEQTKKTIITPTIIVESLSTVENDTFAREVMIQNIKEEILVYQYKETEPNNQAIEYSMIDFSMYSVDSNLDLKKEFLTYPINVVGFENIWNVYFGNDQRSLIYVAYEMISSRSFLYRYDIDEFLENRISNSGDVYYANISTDQNKVVYLLRDGKMYIVNLSGEGKEICSDLFVTSPAVFSPDNKKIAFFVLGQGKSMTHPNLFFMKYTEQNDAIPNNSKLIENEIFKYDHTFTWSTDSKMLIYGIKLGNEKKIICSSPINIGEEVCYENVYFSYIDGFATSEKNKLIISGMVDPIDHEKCVTCGVEDMNTNLYVLDMSTGEFTSISDYQYSEINPMWIEDDKYILYESYLSDTDTWQIFITDPEGSFHEQLTYSDIDTYLY